MEEMLDSTGKQIFDAWKLANEWLGECSRPWEDVYEDMYFCPLAVFLLKFVPRST